MSTTTEINQTNGGQSVRDALGFKGNPGLDPEKLREYYKGLSEEEKKGLAKIIKSLPTEPLGLTLINLDGLMTPDDVVNKIGQYAYKTTYPQQLNGVVKLFRELLHKDGLLPKDSKKSVYDKYFGSDDVPPFKFPPEIVPNLPPGIELVKPPPVRELTVLVDGKEVSLYEGVFKDGKKAKVGDEVAIALDYVNGDPKYHNGDEALKKRLVDMGFKLDGKTKYKVVKENDPTPDWAKKAQEEQETPPSQSRPTLIERILEKIFDFFTGLVN